MADRKVNSITLPSGAVVEIKEYISAGEFIDATDSKDDLAKSELAKRLVQIAIVSVNGVNDNVMQQIRELPLADYLAISKEVAKLTNVDFMPAKNP